MEKEPQRIVRFEFPNITIEATPSNAVVYRHEGGDSIYDHVYVEQEDDPEEESKYYYIFRQSVPDFEQTCNVLRSRGFTFVELNEASDLDKEQYNKLFPPVAELQSYELTPRQERFVNYFKGLLDAEKITPADFDGSGDLYI